MRTRWIIPALAGTLAVASCGVPTRTAPRPERPQAPAARPTYTLEGLATAPIPITAVEASSIRNAFFREAFAADGNPHSAWAPADSDAEPELELTLDRPRTLAEIALKLSPGGVTVDVEGANGEGPATPIATGLLFQEGVLDALPLPAGAAYDHIELHFHSSNADLLAELRVCEVQLFDKPSGLLNDLPAPAVAPNLSSKPHEKEFDLTLAQGDVQLLPGAKTRMDLFNGTWYGPALILDEGDHVKVHFHNRLAEISNVHYHGLAIDPANDGTPFNPIQPGADNTYEFDVRSGDAGTYFYHTHPDGLTAKQVVLGAAGPIVIRDPNNFVPPTFGDTLIAMSDNKFDANNQIPPDNESDLIDGRVGPFIFTNGVLTPFVHLKRGEIRRFRFLNAASARYFDVNFPGLDVLEVGSDGGLFEKPVHHPDGTVLFASAERKDLIVQAPDRPGLLQVKALPFARVPEEQPPATVPIFNIIVDDEAAPPQPPIPTSFRHVEPLVQDGVQQDFTLDVINPIQTGINHTLFDVNRLGDIVAKFGKTELWTITNHDEIDHPMHIHGTQFQVIERNGVPEPYRAWRDIASVPKFEGNVKLLVRFDRFTGEYVFHCHNLQHEFEGMMLSLKVVP